jgi:hypothetical protein
MLHSKSVARLHKLSDVVENELREGAQGKGSGEDKNPNDSEAINRKLTPTSP